MRFLNCIFNKIKRKLKKAYNLLKDLLLMTPQFWVRVLYGDIWKLRKKLVILRQDKKNIPRSASENGWKMALYDSYFSSLGSYIGIDAELEDIPIFPHDTLGVFISNSAHIGKNCVIFQQVTIGSNMLRGSKKWGAPNLANNVYIGCGAKIIGNVNVGENARIGANCVVVKDVPSNSVTVIRGIETMIKEEVLDNTFIYNTVEVRESLRQWNKQG